MTQIFFIIVKASFEKTHRSVKSNFCKRKQKKEEKVKKKNH